MRVSIRRAALAAVIITCVSAGLPAVPAHAFATYYVTNTANSGTGSLRDAINDANGNPGLDSIVFTIKGAGTHMITPKSDLPEITESLIITGYTQGDAAPATATSPARLNVIINGVNMSDGLVIRANASLVTGLDVRNVAGPGKVCGGAGICVLGDNNFVLGDRIGVGADGAVPLPNAGDGVYVRGKDDWIGGPNPADRNVISGNDGNGVAVSGTGNHVAGNYIGTGADGTTDLGNGRNGVRLDGGPASVGGTTGSSGNLISGNGGDGIEVGPAADGCVILGNRVGVNADADDVLPNDAAGVELHSNDNIVGGTADGEFNILAGNIGDGLDVNVPSAGNTIQGNFIGNAPGPVQLPNRGHGVALLSGLASTLAGNTVAGNRKAGVYVPGDNQVIQGNLIGVATDTTGALVRMGNGTDGIRLLADDVQVGGDGPGLGNTISANGGNGISVEPTGQDIPILGNAVYDNTVMPIDLLPYGPDSNDSLDGDTGANNRQNNPTPTGALAGAGTTTVRWQLMSTPDTDYRLEFFAGPTCAAAGTTFLGSTAAATGPMGNDASPAAGTVLGVPAAAGSWLVATATEITPAGTFGATSEFSFCIQVA